MNYQNIIWDFDGTLFDTYPGIVLAVRKVLLEQGVDAPAEPVRELLMDSLDACFQHFISTRALPLDAQALRARYRAQRGESALPFPGIPELVRAFAEKGGRQFLFTHRGSSAVRYLEEARLANYFADVVTWDGEKFKRKPDPSGNLYIIERHDLSRTETIAIGDRELDVLAGKRAGIAACILTHGRRVTSAADDRAESVAELYPVLGL